MKSHYKSKENHEIVIGFPMNLNHHWIKIYKQKNYGFLNYNEWL